MGPCAADLYVALVHYPVLNRKGETIASALTNLDLHDLARAARTYNIPSCYIVTPLKDQQALARRLIRHWCQGVGKELLPERGEALGRLRIVENIAESVREIESRGGMPPTVWASSARERDRVLTHEEARKLLKEAGRPCLLLLGTGWGLAPEALNLADALLEPIRGINGYNHLSVRCAAAILLDRLLGIRGGQE
ncbi:MAG: RNA methyltransferase [Syntrophobacteraceae bacterium]|nr:RNA methyltransferase [Syntrophobacteraceae bacterium]